MFIKKSRYEAISKVGEEQAEEIKELKEELASYKDDSGHAQMERLLKLASDCKIDVHSDTFQGIMTRLFLDIGGRENPMLKTYSATTFLKDVPEELVERLEQHIQEKNLLTSRKGLKKEGKVKK